jgi:hypothetical protein
MGPQGLGFEYSVLRKSGRLVWPSAHVVRIHTPDEVSPRSGRCLGRPLMESKFARGERGFEYRWDRKVCVSSTLLSALETGACV